MTNPNAAYSSATYPSLRLILGGAVLLFAINGSAHADQQEQQTHSTVAVESFDLPDKAASATAAVDATVQTRSSTASRDKTRQLPTVYCWDGENEFDINTATDRKHKNIGSTCLLAVKEGWYKNNPKTEVKCLVRLWTRESQFNHTADNKYSSAYGIPQSLPGNKMASAGKDWATNPKTQIAWGLGYISDRYNTPCNAWEHSERKGWY